MKYFDYTVRNSIGLHARPASNLIITVWTQQFEITLEKGEETTDPKGLISVPALNINQGDIIRITTTDVDGEEAIARMEEFVKKNL